MQTINYTPYVGPNDKHSKKHGSKWYQSIEHKASLSNEAGDCSEMDDADDENELSDDDDLNNNNVNNRTSLLSCNHAANESGRNCIRDFFDCLRFRRNYKRNRKKSDEGQSTQIIVMEIRFSFSSLYCFLSSCLLFTLQSFIIFTFS